ncbi:MAG TPA: hypothetical protein VFU09_03460 [Candidatus Udaeobacter sp.]|nr:hypothetical protein [Candidatus Udaeobacter sp.]
MPFHYDWPEVNRHVGYLAKHLSKEGPECLFQWRLWAGFGKDWEWTKVKDVIRETLFSQVYRACKEWKGSIRPTERNLWLTNATSAISSFRLVFIAVRPILPLLLSTRQ